ncbi:MAG TPA: flagellar basal body rod protein FlgC [Chthoniobacterales bacterium]|nr:flagellar basal body rod protein FlgC [Chthoniobacterales bacterium]
MNIISGINVTASALAAEKLRMDLVAQNIANAHTTHDVDGHPYKRKVVSFETCIEPDSDGEKGVRVAQISNDNTPGEMVYKPGHPDANKDGMVEMPNVNLATEMVDLLSSSRAYEANLAVVRNAKQMAMKALSIGH